MSKPSILLIPDVPGWAFDARATDIISKLSSEYTFTKKYSVDLKNEPTFDYSVYDAIFIFYWPHRAWLNLTIPKEKLISGVYSYTCWENNKEDLQRESALIGTLITTNPKLKADLSFLNRDIEIVPHAINSKTFYPKKRSSTSDKLIVGWAGNPNHKDSEYKGYWTIIKPVCDENASWIELKSALSTTPIPPQHMIDFYNSLDVLTCMSRGETGPLPVLEAGACGVPVIATPVGVVPELITSGTNGFIIERTKEALEEKLRYLYEHKDRIPQLGDALRKEIEKNWSTEKITVTYRKIFNSVLSKQSGRERT